MKAIVLAAGRGTHLRPMTDHTPKPLLQAGAQRVIEYQLKALSDAGFRDVVVNVAYRAQQVMDVLGDGSRYGLSIHYSHEQNGRLETGGGIVNALPLLGDAPFLAVSGDVFTDFPFDQLPTTTDSAHLVLVDNPKHHPSGDFYLKNGRVNQTTGERLTYANIGVLNPRLFDGLKVRVFPLSDVLRRAIATGSVTGEHYKAGCWINVASPRCLDQIAEMAGKKANYFKGGVSN